MAIMDAVRRAEFEWSINDGEKDALLLLYSIRKGVRFDAAVYLPSDLKLIDSGIRAPVIDPASPETKGGHFLWARYEAEGR